MTQTYLALAVDDDADSLALLRVVLSELPLSVVDAHTGGAAVDFLKDHEPDLLFLDIGLPDIRGWGILDQFRHDPRLSGMRVIVLTSHGEPAHRLIGKLHPVTAYLRKPIDAAELRRVVRQALNL